MGHPKRKLKFAEDFYVRALLNKVKLEDIMTAPVITVNVNTPFHEVADKIRQNRVRHLPVVDEKEKLVGLLTERELFKTQSPRRLEDGTWYYDPEALDGFILKNVMIKDPFTMSPNDTAAEAILEMVRLKYACVCIIKEDRVLAGIITYIDFLELAAQIISEK